MRRLDGEPISSLDNPHVRLARSLLTPAGRRRHRAFLVEGVRLVEAAAEVAPPQLVLHTPDLGRHDARSRRLLQQLRQRGTEVRAVTERVLAQLTDTVTPQGLVAIVPRASEEQQEAALQRATREGTWLLLILDAIGDPGNAGTLLRAAAGAGASAVIATRGTVDLYAPKVVRAAAGAHFGLALVAGWSWERLRAWLPAGSRLWVADARGATRYWEIDWLAPSALVVGNEAHGVSEPVRAIATGTVSIPLIRGESLNAAVAGSIILFEAVRQRFLAQQFHVTPELPGAGAAG